MPTFQVQDCKGGPGKSPWVKIAAGMQLRDRGKPGELRARVVRDGDLTRQETAFYADAE
jgi:hypothetical protein